MLLILLLAAMSGGAALFAALWPYGWLVALLGASLGGSALTAAVAVLLASRRARQAPAATERRPANDLERTP